jgi:catechol 2,3-dioxygenase-like lactoylglutathione lyase family enzyme
LRSIRTRVAQASIGAVIAATLAVGLGGPVGAQSPPSTFWHVGLVVDDLDAMAEFYRDVIGLAPVTDLLVQDSALDEHEPGAIVTHRLDELMRLTGTEIRIRHFSDPTHTRFLELLAYPAHPAEAVERGSNRPLGLNHLGLTVRSLDAVIERIETSGTGRLLSGPVALPDFGGRFAFVADPEGNLLELRELDRD